MCVRRVPLHPWCDCDDPDNLTDGGPGCPHHVYIDPEHLNVLCRSPDSQWETEFENVLDYNHYPDAEWIRCDTYLTCWTINGSLQCGWEMRCPETVAKMALDGPAGYKEFYLWDGFCAQCDHGQGIPLRVVKVSELEAEDDILVDPLTGASWHVPADQPRLVDSRGVEVDEDIVDSIVNQRPDASKRERIFVHVAEDPERSGIYLLPRPFYAILRPGGSLLASVRTRAFFEAVLPCLFPMHGFRDGFCSL